MEVVDQIRWIPDFGYERELDWLRNMHDWMISKKRYWGSRCRSTTARRAAGSRSSAGARSSRSARSRAGTSSRATRPHRPYVDAVKIACPGCGAPVERIKDVGNPWLGRRDRAVLDAPLPRGSRVLATWFPADFITESFPGQFRNWFYSMLAMSTVLRREPPFKTIFGYATLFAEDGRPMHKSWGNAIEFDEAAERMGVDVMRWMFAKARPEENILFGWHAADEARRELLILWNVYAFFVTYARLAGWSPEARTPAGRERRVLDRWILSRAAGTAAIGRGPPARRRCVGRHARAVVVPGRPVDVVPAAVAAPVLAVGDAADRGAAFATLHEALVATARMLAPDPAVPRRVDVRQPGRGGAARGARQRPPHPLAAAELAERRDEGSSARWRRAGRGRAGPDAAATAHLKTRQPLATAWLAMPDPRRDRRGAAPDRRRRDQRQGRRRHRRRVRARRAAGQAAPAEDREAARVRDPRGHGRARGGRVDVRGGRLGDARPGSRWRRTRSRSRPPRGRARPWRITRASWSYSTPS
jgi:isoleucyl-tRNA synthetase